MSLGKSYCRSLFGIAALASILISSPASAVSMNGFGDGGFEYIFGSYAPGGDCSGEPRMTIDAAGMTFRANGRALQVSRFEYAASFFGMAYDGITLAFYPFPRGEYEMGDLFMLVNDDERAGTVRIESNAEQGKRLDPFHAALLGNYSLCAGTGSGVAPPQVTDAEPVPGVPLDWDNLRSQVGRYPGSYSEDNIDLFDKGEVAAALRALLGAKMEVLEVNLSTVGPLERQGNLYYIYGNAPHRGGEDQAYVLIDSAKRAVQVGLWEQGKLTVYPPASGRLAVPPNIQTMLNNSPGESAVAAPGTPWELLPIQGRAPAAYVEAAASTSITSLSIYCENGRPYAAMLLGRGAAGARVTLTWNFAGGLVDIPMQRANNDGTYWVGVASAQLLRQLMAQKDPVLFRIDGRMEGQASLAQAPTVVRTALQQCVRF